MLLYLFYLWGPKNMTTHKMPLASRECSQHSAPTAHTCPPFKALLINSTGIGLQVYALLSVWSVSWFLTRVQVRFIYLFVYLFIVRQNFKARSITHWIQLPHWRLSTCSVCVRKCLHAQHLARSPRNAGIASTPNHTSCVKFCLWWYAWLPIMRIHLYDRPRHLATLLPPRATICNALANI